MKEKMLIKLEKERLAAKVDSLSASLKQMGEEQESKADDKTSQAYSPKKKAPATTFKMTNTPSQMPQHDRMNPMVNEEFEPSGSHLSC